MLITHRNSPQSHYDCIVIGSGLGGMTAANTLAKRGHRILLLEAHNKLGGLATWFYRENQHIFDISLHGFPYGMVKTCRKYWNQDIADHIVQLQSIRFQNPQFSLDTTFTREDYSRHLCETFHLSQTLVKNFFETLQSFNFYDQNLMTTQELFQQFFPQRNDVHRFLLEPITYANGSTLEDPALTYSIVFNNFLNKGVFTFKGGTDFLMSKMRAELIKNGVDIKLQSYVSKIAMKKNGQQRSVEGVWLKEQLIKAPCVLSNTHLWNTLFKLIGEENLSESHIAAVRNVRNNTSSCQVYMGLKPAEKIPFQGDLLFTSTADHFDTNLLLAPKITSRTYSFYYPEGRPQSPETSYAIVSSTNARYEDWKNLNDTQYEQAKKVMEEETLDHLETILPNIRQKLHYVESATPLTIERFTHHPQGSSFGTKYEGLKVSQNLPQEIEGLYHAGSVGIIMSGWLGAANYGVIVSNDIDRFLMQKDLMKEHNLGQMIQSELNPENSSQ